MSQDINKLITRTNTRRLAKKSAYFISACLVVMSLIHLYQIAIGVFEATLERSLHLLFAIPLAFLSFSAVKDKSLKTIPWYDILCAFLGLLSFGWIIFNHERIMWRMPYLDEPTNWDMLFGMIAVILVLEATRRTVGMTLSIVTLLFILYSFFGNVLPGLFHHDGVPLFLFVDHIYLTTEGLFSNIIGVISIYTFIFICFGAFMEVTGVGNFYIDFANAVMGRFSGGVAKTAVFSSALMGSVSGSSVANTATTGAFTIPLMKKTGFSAEEAGAVEVAASTGGQMLPPVMGAGAFIMAEFTGTPYLTIVMVSILPALMYYGMVFFSVHILARKKGLKGLPESDRSALWPTLKKGYHLLLPIVVLVYLLVRGYTPYYAGFLCIVFLLIVSSFSKEHRFNLVKILRSLDLASRRIIKISPASACAGIILGVSTQTGVALKISSIILSASSGRLFLAIILVAFIAYILGMGLPTTSAYILVAILASPALVKLGLPMLVAHLIAFWFSQTSGFTPPVCLCAYTAAAISDGDPMQTGYKSLRLSLGIFLIPFLFAYSPIIFVTAKATFWHALWVSLTGLAGLLSLTAVMEGFLHDKLGGLERGLLLISAVLLFTPHYRTDLIGLLVLSGVVIYIFTKQRKVKRHV